VELEPTHANLQVAVGQHAEERTGKEGVVEGAVARAGVGRAEVAVEDIAEVAGEECDEEEAVQSLGTWSDEQDEGGRVGEKDDEVEVQQPLEIEESTVEA